MPILRSERLITKPGKWDTLWRGHDRPTMRYELFGITPESGQWRWAGPRGKRAEANYKKYMEEYADRVDIDTYYLDHLESTGETLDFVRLSEETVQAYIPPQADRLANNVWMDIPHMGTTSDYPTEKSEAFVRRIVQWASLERSIVLDAFIGSGTACVVAQKLGRRWIACDINKGAIQATSKRAHDAIVDQVDGSAQGSLTDIDKLPAQLSFTTWRVNDYDLQIQHNEAVELDCQHVGVQRTHTDGFFDGTLGKNLVKIVPFTHPLSPIDLETMKAEFEARPEEDRSITVICLGIELGAKRWIEDWNRLRRGRNAINRIEYIELRSDAKHGGWIKHEPASAKVDIQREDDRVVIEIKDFVSPAIVERLRRQTGVTKPKIDNWRAMVDSVMIDTDYDNEVFNIALSDVPERKQDFVAGRYELPASDKDTVAVKITDMLGKEVLVTDSP